MDSTEAIDERLDRIVNVLKHGPKEPCILVGHSHLFRSLCRKYAPSGGILDHYDQEMAEKIRKFKLGNSSVLRLEIAFKPAPPPDADGEDIHTGQPQVRVTYCT